MKKKVLNVCSVFFSIPYFLGDQINYFVQKGYDISLICSPSDGKLETYSKKNSAKYKEVEILRQISLISDVKAVLSIYKYIKDNQIDIVSGHSPKGALVAMIASFFARVKRRIYFRHGIMFETSTGFKRMVLVYIERLTALLATDVVVVSPSVFQKSIEYGLNSGRKQIILSKGTCSGIDVYGRFNPALVEKGILNDLSARFGINDSDIILGFVGRLARDKGIIELVESFQVLKQKYDNLYLLLVGVLDERDTLPKRIIELINSDKKIISTGLIEEKIQYYYSLMDVFILPSYREGFPTTVLEASSLQLPVITTKVTGCIDSILENKTGLFTDINIEGIVAVVSSLLENNEKCVDFGGNGRKFVVDNFEQGLVWNEIEKKLYSN